MTTGTYTGSYASIVNPGSVSFTIAATGTVSGTHTPASVYLSLAAGTLTNLGKVKNTQVSGVLFKKGGAVINGSSSNTTAYIKGYSNGVSLLSTTAGTVTNYGLIESTYRSTGTGPFGYTNADNYHTGKIGFDGVYLHAGGRITNTGTASNIYGWAGVQSGGGSLTVTNAGTIAGYSYGVSDLKGSTGLSVNNSGLIHGRVNQAILAYSGTVSITNTGTLLASGTVSEYVSFGSAGNLYPGGIYLGGGVSAGATVTNGSASNSTALIDGYSYGIFADGVNASTITNWGTIEEVGTKYISSTGTKTGPQTAVSFGFYPLVADRVVNEPGAKFVGLVQGGGAASVLELGSTAGTGTIGGVGTQFLGFGNVSVDFGAKWNVTGSNMIAASSVGTGATTATLTNAGTLDVTGTLTLGTGAVLSSSGVIEVSGGEFLANISLGAAGAFQVGSGGVIDFNSSVSSGAIHFLDATGKLILADRTGVTLGVSGLVHGDQIDLTSVAYDTGHMTATYSGGHLEVFDNGTLEADIHATGLPGPVVIPSNDGTGHTQITPCYCRGTRILTDRGEVAVEDLAIGDRVVTADGTTRPIRWIGFRTLDLTRHPVPEQVRPILIHADAVADRMPARALRVSPDHALLLDGVLIVARQLINGASIERDVRCDSVTYYHIELETHDILLAEGLPAESYLDTGNRGTFENAAAPLTLHPDLECGQQQRVARSCRPLVDDASTVEPHWQRLALRGMLLGHNLPEEPESTSDPAPRIVIGGRVIKPMQTDGNRYTFVLPPIDGPVRLTSRIARPCDARPWVEDRRRLGVAVSRLILRRDADLMPVPLDHPLLTEGWWEVEHDHASRWRWTNGNAVLPISAIRPAILEVTVEHSLDYAVVPDAAAVRRHAGIRTGMSVVAA